MLSARTVFDVTAANRERRRCANVAKPDDGAVHFPSLLHHVNAVQVPQ